LQTQRIGRQEAKRGLLAADGTCKDLVCCCFGSVGAKAKGKGKHSKDVRRIGLEGGSWPGGPLGDRVSEDHPPPSSVDDQ
jgi:hypothetical protein